MKTLLNILSFVGKYLLHLGIMSFLYGFACALIWVGIINITEHLLVFCLLTGVGILCLLYVYKMDDKIKSFIFKMFDKLNS